MYKNYNKKQDQLAGAFSLYTFIPLRSHHEYSNYRDQILFALFVIICHYP